jgi:putative peptidoglycan lipid II flippase
MESGSKERIAKSASRVSGATIVSRILGLGRDSVFAAFFGTSYLADAFMVAFLIPNFLRRLFGEGLLHSSYVPVYTHYLHNEGKKSAIEFAAKIFSTLTVILIIVVAAGVTVKLTRILFPYIFFVGLASLAGGTLNSLGRFTVPALAPAFLNISLIATAFTAVRMVSGSGESMVTVFSVGALIGGAFQVVFQLPQLLGTGHRLRFDPDFGHPGVKWVGRLMLPGLLVFAVTQINVLVDTLLATLLSEGSVTALRLGNRIAVQPMGIFGVAITTAALPALSAHAARQDKTKLVEDFTFSLRLIWAFLIPSTVVLTVLATPIIRLIFERGEFSATESTPLTAMALFYYATGLFAYGGVKAVVQAFYSLKDTVTPMKVAIINVGLNITLNIILVRRYGLIGLALATAISSTVAFAILIWMLRRRLGMIRGHEILAAVSRIVVASAFMAVVLYIVASRLSPLATDIWGKLAQVGVSCAAGLGAYLLASFLLRAREVTFLLGLLFRKGRAR